MLVVASQAGASHTTAAFDKPEEETPSCENKLPVKHKLKRQKMKEFNSNDFLILGFVWGLKKIKTYSN